MKQFQIAYKNDEAFLKELEEIKRWCDTTPSYTTLFRIYSEDMDLEHLQHVCDILDSTMPEALYLGSTTQANILNGALTRAKIILTCTVFEYETTQAELLCFPFSEENAKEVVQKLKTYCDANPWVTAVEMHATMLGMSLKEFCKEISTLRSEIQVYGGGACNPDPSILRTNVFGKGRGFSERGIVFLLLGGSDFHLYSTYISGWQPLERRFTITKARGEILYELDGEPAFHVYQRFLNIEKNDQFVSNTLAFPLSMDHNGIDVLRCPMAANDDDSLSMTSEVEEGAEIRLAFGDPDTILSHIRQDGQNIADFQPEVIQAFSCAARRSFWGDENVSDETVLFNSVAPTSGFYTGGEFLRIDGDVLHFNITLVLAAMREGEAKHDHVHKTRFDSIESDRISLIKRFVSFIEAATVEFDALNKKLTVISVTDGLTSLYNRAEIESRIRSTLDDRAPDEPASALSLIMLDIDNFKRINDAYGHKEGDRVIIALSDILRKVLSGEDSAYSGRWGGEEFMVLLKGRNVDEAVELAEKIRTEFASVSYETAGCQTVSVGVTQARDGEDADTLYSRVDKALYTAKANGKNQVVTLK